MAYFGGSQGGRGDPGFFGTLFGAVKGGLLGAVTGGPLSAISGAIRGGRRASRPTPQLPAAFLPPTGTGGGVPRLLGPGKSLVIRPDGTLARRRRRTNFANPRALRRAISRQNGFVRLAKGALKNSGFKVVSTSSGKVSRATMDKAVAKARADAHHAK